MIGDSGTEFSKAENSRPEPALAAAMQAEIVGLQAKIEHMERKDTLILSLRNAIASVRHKGDLLELIDQRLRALFDFDDFVICLINEDGQTHSPFVYNQGERFAETEGIAPKESRRYSLDDGMCRAMMNADKPIVFDVAEVLQWEDAPAWLGFWKNKGIQEMIGLQMVGPTGCIGFFYLYTKHKHSLQHALFDLLYGLSLQISVAIANIQANEKIELQLREINAYKEQLEEEKTYLKEEIGHRFNHNEIIGQNESLREIFHMIDQVAPADSTVLILGETGTGKELIARAIHNASSRREKLMVKINCAALPAALAESELFGHEKGSFTGATERRIGKFELAHQGTLFLDEVGELAPEIQVKLLRALQEKEIERVGGKSVIRTDVRILAATNRDLLQEVEKGNFRSDLYYRLNVFPLVVPPLRERADDIPQLAAHFIDKISRKTGRDVQAIAKSALNKLVAYPWPGNIRELEHLMERSILLAPGNVLKEIHLPKVNSSIGNTLAFDGKIKTIHENERDHILQILKRCKGKISGLGGAAELLGIPATTLNSKIKKFGIKREHILNS
jgi:formate hydrogenlyase transcriptional activator